MAKDLSGIYDPGSRRTAGHPLQKLRRWDATRGTGSPPDRRRPPALFTRDHRWPGRFGRQCLRRKKPILPRPETDRMEDKLAAARRTLKEKRRIIQLFLESESRYRDLVETSHDLIWTTDAQGRSPI